MNMDWFAIALEFRAHGYSMGEMIFIMALCCVAITGEARTAMAAAYRMPQGRDQ